MSAELKDFLDPSFPLLEKFREVSPGSYKHCQNVMNMCESVALELGLDVDLMKVAAMYHDIGKMNNTKYFSENQDETNPHDNLDAQVSCQIITKHVGDGILRLLHVEDMPRRVLEIISQHHGTTITKAFFKKSGSSVEDHFRYKSEIPSSVEAAVLMIVDSVEATARSMSSNGKMNGQKSKKAIVSRTIERLVEDSQLDEIKIGVLKVVSRVLIRELENIYHKRVSYDDDDENNNSDENDSERVEIDIDDTK